MAKSTDAVWQVAWYHKPHPTFFSDELALIGRELWGPGDFLRVTFSDRPGKSPAGVRRTANLRGLLYSVNG